MDNTRKMVATGVIASVLLSGGIAWLLGGHETVKEVTIRESAPQGEQGYGALAGPDIPSAYLRWGGIPQYGFRMSLNTATNTPCAIQSPAATSTLLAATLNISSPTSTATTWYVSTSTGQYATTTNFAAPMALASGKLGTFSVGATTTQTNWNTVDNAWVLPPSSWIVWTVAGTVIADATKLNGSCQARFESI